MLHLKYAICVEALALRNPPGALRVLRSADEELFTEVAEWAAAAPHKEALGREEDA